VPPETAASAIHAKPSPFTQIRQDNTLKKELRATRRLSDTVQLYAGSQSMPVIGAVQSPMRKLYQWLSPGGEREINAID
jgi:hypothetical protein